MEVRFEVKMTPKIMYEFLLNHTYRSVAGVIGILIGGSSLAMFFGSLGKTDVTYSILYLVFGIWFLLYLPINLYMRAKRQVQRNAVFKKPVKYMVSDKGIRILQEEQQGECGWDSIWKVRKTRRCILVYSSMKNAFVFPKEAIGGQYDTLVELFRKNLPQKKVKL